MSRLLLCCGRSDRRKTHDEASWLRGAELGRAGWKARTELNAPEFADTNSSAWACADELHPHVEQ